MEGLNAAVRAWDHCRGPWPTMSVAARVAAMETFAGIASFIGQRHLPAQEPAIFAIGSPNPVLLLRRARLWPSLRRAVWTRSGSCVDDEPLLGFSRSLIDFDRTRVDQNLIQDAYLYLSRSSTFRRKKFLMRHKRSCGSIAAG
jgi:hypothetical protein